MNEAFTVPAARGAALLDEKIPGWHKVVDTEVLNISSGSYCVAGQVGRALHPVLHAVEGYLGVVRMIVPPERRNNLVPEVYGNGFCVSGEQVFIVADPNRELTRAWINEINARRALDQAAVDAATVEAQVETEVEVDRTPVPV